MAAWATSVTAWQRWWIPPATVTLVVGQEFDLHTTTNGPSGATFYPLRTSLAPAVVQQVSTLDGNRDVSRKGARDDPSS